MNDDLIGQIKIVLSDWEDRRWRHADAMKECERAGDEQEAELHAEAAYVYRRCGERLANVLKAAEALA